jgi:hypothetical protein
MDLLAQTFALRYARDPVRGYGGGAARLLRGIIEGSAWRTLSETFVSGRRLVRQRRGDAGRAARRVFR